ncbi:hypothetical protein ACFSSG_02170 [Euzebyella marina]|uniref:hypothetical protein n=1 Tax=Euzebyella marina TaxID=1761453 RepID=UPI001CE2A1BF|nr:hypothetical protein [Euzebyella marina]
MNLYPSVNYIIILLTIAIGTYNPQALSAQIEDGVYLANSDGQKHELKISGDYLTWSVYAESPAKFIKTLGGFYTVDGEKLFVNLEFNSDYALDGVKEVSHPVRFSMNQIIINEKLTFQKADDKTQELDGLWLFATRGPDTGQERRGDENPRKTLKFLLDGRFQWIAYNTDSFEFHGTGGGAYTSKDGIYTENIEYFSRDNSRVGATLEFNYELKGNDWHHTGKNSKGEPMYEIWAKR